MTALFNALSPRARRVLALLVSGYTCDKEIAAALGVSISTVKAAFQDSFEATGTAPGDACRVKLALFVERDTELKHLLLAGFRAPIQEKA